MTRVLGVFAKHWRPGTAKTRLAETIGPAAASSIALAMLRLTLERFARIAHRRVLAFTPRESEAEFGVLAGSSWSLSFQGAGDLGRRMRRFFEESFRQGAS